MFGPKDLKISSVANLGDYSIAAAKGNTEEIALSEIAPKAKILRMENDAAAAAAYISGQTQLYVCSGLTALELAKKDSGKEFDMKFAIRPSPGHMAVKLGESNMLQWMNSYIFFITVNGDLEKLHQKWLGRGIDKIPSL